MDPTSRVADNTPTPSPSPHPHHQGEGGSEGPKSLRRTFSQDEEEERTAGSGIDLLSEEAFCPPGNAPGGGEGGASPPEPEQESHDLSDKENADSLLKGGATETSLKVIDGQEKDVAEEKDMGVDKSNEKDVGVASERDVGVAEEGVAPAVEKQVSEMERVVEVNPTYAKYIMEKQKASKELRLKSKTSFSPSPFKPVFF